MIANQAYTNKSILIWYKFKIWMQCFLNLENLTPKKIKMRFQWRKYCCGIILADFYFFFNKNCILQY